MSKTCVLYGVDSVFSAEVVETLRRIGFTSFVGVLTGEREWGIDGIDTLCEDSGIEHEWLSLPVIVPWVTPRLRRERTIRARKAGFIRFEPVLDPAAIVASTVRVGEGAFVNAGAVLGAYSKLGEGVTVNRNASIGHHTVIGDFSAVGPGVAIAARCTIGPGALIGAGAAVAPGLLIGANSTVSLGAAVIRNVPESAMVAGTPARVIRTRRRP